MVINLIITLYPLFNTVTNQPGIQGREGGKAVLQGGKERLDPATEADNNNRFFFFSLHKSPDEFFAFCKPGFVWGTPPKGYPIAARICSFFGV